MYMTSFVKIVAIIIGLFCVYHKVRGFPDESVIERVCSGNNYIHGDSYRQFRESVLYSAIKGAIARCDNYAHINFEGSD